MRFCVAAAALSLTLASVGLAVSAFADAPPDREGPDGGSPQSAPGSVLDGAYSEAQAQRGEVVYLQYCVTCHGPNLDGGDMTPALVGAVFNANWNDLTLGDLFERIRISMPLDRPGALNRQQNADVIAFVLKSNRWPAGPTELAREPAALRQIKIQSTR
jgi:mono/diheme cytochrome c family protein